MARHSIFHHLATAAIHIAAHRLASRAAPVARAAVRLDHGVKAPDNVDSAALLTFAFAYLGDMEGYDGHALPCWWRTVRERIMPAYCAAHGPRSLQPATMLTVARKLKFFYDQRAKDTAEFYSDNLDWVQDA